MSESVPSPSRGWRQSALIHYLRFRQKNVNDDDDDDDDDVDDGDDGDDYDDDDDDDAADDDDDLGLHDLCLIYAFLTIFI